VLQTLKAKIPALIDKMVAGRICHENYSSITKEGLRILLKRKWDPAATALAEQKLVCAINAVLNRGKYASLYCWETL